MIKKKKDWLLEKVTLKKLRILIMKIIMNFKINTKLNLRPLLINL
jgi:hypothetical protein